MSRSETRVDRAPTRLGAPLQVATGAVLVLAVAGATLPGRPAELTAGAMVAVLVAAPLVRVAALAWWWYRAGDRRFAAVAAGLLAVIASGAGAALAG